MRLMLSALTLSFASLLVGCTTEAESTNTRSYLAVAEVCAVTDTATVKAAAFDTTGEVTAIPAPPIDPPPPPPPGTAPLLCCNAVFPDTCTPHEIPITECEVQPTATDAVTKYPAAVGPYDGTPPPTAIYGCEGDHGGDQCQPGDGAYTLSVGGAVAAVAFDSPTQIRIYHVDDDVLIKNELGDELHAVLAPDEYYANHDRPVYENGVLIGYINDTTDCEETECGFVCSIC